MTKTDTQANLIRAHETLGNLIARGGEHEWAAFYDALQYVPGVEDAAADALTDTLADLGLDSDGFRCNDDGDQYRDNEGYWMRDYIPMTPIYMPGAA